MLMVYIFFLEQNTIPPPCAVGLPYGTRVNFLKSFYRFTLFKVRFQ